MKKLFLLIMLLLGMHAYSQNYYTRETIEGTHATYFSLSWLADGYNIIANSQSYSRLNTSALYKDGTPVYPDSYKCVRSSDPNGSILMSIVKSADDKTKNIYRWFHESVSIKFKDIK